MTATASAAPSATRPAATAPAGQARGVRQSQGASFDDAFLALLLGAADGPPELPIALAEPPSGEPAPLDATTEETATALEGVATAEAFPLPDLAAPWLALRDSLVPPPAAPLAPDADGGTEAQPGLAALDANGAEAPPRAPRRAPVTLAAAAAAAEFAKADPEAPAEEPVPGNATALPAARPDASPDSVRKAAFAPTLAAAAEALRHPARAEAPPPAPAPADAPTLAAEPGSAAFREGFAERVTILTRGGRTEAELTLHPADLGPIEVKIRIEDGQASFQFDAPHAGTRQAIEDSLPRLAEMLAGNGISLGGTHVGQSGRDAQDASAPEPGAGRSRREAEGAGSAPAGVTRVRVADPGRVDLYA